MIDSQSSHHVPTWIDVSSVDLTIPIFPNATGWGPTIARPPQVAVTSVDLTSSPLKAISLLPRQSKIKTISYAFPELPQWRKVEEDSKPAAHVTTSSKAPAHAPTRIKPPTDIVKLEDRLYYLLQPPLETILASHSLHMPFEPFPYQYQGVAFLYPRYAAILADEMGLGKTMQAITAVRMLLRAGEVRSVLLICPKPLVTNWKREFSSWAP